MELMASEMQKEWQIQCHLRIRRVHLYTVMYADYVLWFMF